MARLWSSGLELNSTSIEVGSSVGVSSSIVRSGTYSLHKRSGTAIDVVAYSFSASNQQSSYYARCYINVATLPSLLGYWLSFINSSSSRIVSVQLTTGGVVKLWNSEDNAQIGSDGPTLTTGVWYRVELFINTTTLSSTSCELKIDGTTVASGTANLATGVAGVQWGAVGNQFDTTAVGYFDDLAINDSSGSFQNSYPGAGKIIHLKPNAAGDNSDWTNDYQNVDEVTPDDASTLVSSNTLDQIDDHNIEAPAYLGDSDTVNVVQVGVRFNGAGASANASFVLRIKASASGTVEESSAITPSNTTWVTNAAAAPRNYSLTLYDLPGASTTAWTKADLASAQIGYRLSSTSTNAAQISTVWLLVDYTPATASGVSLCFWKPYANQPPASNYATLDTRNLHPVLDFDKTTQESAIFRGVMPRSYSGGDITVYLHWAATTVTTGTGGWDVAFERIGDGQQDIDSDGFAAAQQIGPDTVPATTGNVIITSVTMSNSACDSIAAGESFRLRVRRDVTNDNADNDLELLGVELREKT